MSIKLGIFDWSGYNWSDHNILDIRYPTQNFWVFGLFSSSGILENRKHDVSKTGSVSILRWGGEKSPTQLGPVERANLNHWTTPVQSYITTDGQPASLSWNKAPIWGLWPDLDYCLTVAGLLVCWFGAPSLTRGRVCHLQLLLTFASTVIFGSESRRTRGHILLSEIRDFPFRRLLWLAGSQWRYSTPPPHGCHNPCQIYTAV
jgi:hypothetical protein